MECITLSLLVAFSSQEAKAAQFRGVFISQTAEVFIHIKTQYFSLSQLSFLCLAVILSQRTLSNGVTQI